MEDSVRYRVDIDVANETKAGLSEFIDGKDSRVLNRVGAFASLFALDLSRYRDPVLVLKTEEPGSKQVLAFQHDRIESVCEDMINHLINDCIVMGAEPLAVQDLVVCGRNDPDIQSRRRHGRHLPSRRRRTSHRSPAESWRDCVQDRRNRRGPTSDPLLG